jgi:hypothetical protein
LSAQLRRIPNQDLFMNRFQSIKERSQRRLLYAN